MPKREDYIGWDQYFMEIAKISAKRSKDPNTQVGACLVDNKIIIGIGYNGLPHGCDDDEFPWDRQSDNQLETKYLYVVHAEINAILNTSSSKRGTTLYTVLFPCNE